MLQAIAFFLTILSPENTRNTITILSSDRDLMRFNSLSAIVVSAAVIFANSFDPHQAPQNVWPDLDQNCLTFSMICSSIFLLKRLFLKKKKNQQATKNKNHKAN